MGRYQPVSVQIALNIRGTWAQIRRTVVDTIDHEHSKIMEAAPRPSGFRRYVDGMLGAPVDMVRRNVLIEYQRLDLVVQEAMDALFDFSPVLTGAYRTSHQIFVNGVAAPNLKDWQSGDEIVISNFLPYSRKIEFGLKPDGTGMKMRVPGTDHVYEQAEDRVKRRYGNIASIRFTFRGVIGGGLAGGKSGNQSQNRFPALIIRER